jgi:hypothetical protein
MRPVSADLTSSEEPVSGAPVPCGALGDYDLDRVRAIAAGLGDAMREVHADERSILLSDREPIRWGDGRERGYSWPETGVWRGRASSWEEASKLGGCGLALDGRRRLVHSSVSGLARLYWIEDRGATYFASRIDALVGAWPRPLSVDWDAWAATIILRHPVRDRTPFAEIRRLAPHSAIVRRLGRTRIECPTWPWGEVEPHLSLDAGADAWVAALREALAPLGSEILCPLSGGRDSRILLSAIPADRDVVAITVDDDEGGRFEEDHAAPVTQILGVPHEELRGRAEDYRRDWHERARRVEYQFVDHAWLVPLADRIAGAGPPVLDGMAIDVTFQAGERFYTAASLDTSRPRAASAALFEAVRRFGHAQMALAEGFRAPLLARAREQYMAEMRRFEGHPSQGILGVYSTRTVRGTSSYPSELLGHSARMIVPGASDAVASAALAIPAEAKRGGHLYPAVLHRLAPRIAPLPSTTTARRTPPRLPRRWCSEAAVAGYRDLLGEGPLASHIAPELRAWLEAPGRGELDGHLRMGMEGIALLHAWWRRYRNSIGEVDGDELARG